VGRGSEVVGLKVLVSGAHDRNRDHGKLMNKLPGYEKDIPIRCSVDVPTPPITNSLRCYR
jgi:hypothetical protein